MHIKVEKGTWKLSWGDSLRLAGMEVEQSMSQGNAGHERSRFGHGRIWCSMLYSSS